MLSLLLIAAIIAARISQKHSPAVRRYLTVMVITNATLEAVQHLIGYLSPDFAWIYDCLDMLIIFSMVGVVWEAWHPYLSPSKAESSSH